MLKYRSLFVFFSGILRANVTLVSSATNPAAVVDMALTIERTSDTFQKLSASFRPLLVRRSGLTAPKRSPNISLVHTRCCSQNHSNHDLFVFLDLIPCV